MEVGICAGRPCVLVARFFHRHAHSSKFYGTQKAPGFVIPVHHFTLQPHNSFLCLSSRVQEDTSQNAAGTRMIKAKFILRRRCEFGQQFCIIGDDKLLGGWAPEAAIPMQWSEGHVWTLQLDLLSGTCAEFKILLKADEEVVEWQPGPNRKLEVSDSVTSLLVFVPWSDGDDSVESETLQSLGMNDVQRTQDIIEIASSMNSLPDKVDKVENVDLETDAMVFLDATDKPKTEERSADSETVVSNAKDFVDKKQASAKELITEDRGLIDEGTYSISKPSENFLSLYPIPESWNVKESSDIQASHNFTDPSPGLLEVNATTRTLTSAAEISVNEESKAGYEAFLSNKSNDFFAEAKDSDADNEPIFEKENDEQLTGEDELADTIAPSNVRTVLSHNERKDVQKGNAQKAMTQREQNGAFTEPEEEFNVDLTVLHSGESNDNEQFIDPIEVSAETSVRATVATPAKIELPGTELSSKQSDSSESVDTRPAKNKRWGPKGWSKLWSAIVQGRIE